jgi:ATPase family AAA domain-containing protein 3A/B
MVAERFAEYSGMEYAIMCGGDVAPLQDDAVTELHKLFKWVHRSRKGVLLFIDEADSFLASRKGANMSEHLRNALTTMLYHTGTPTSQFMLVLATNRPDDLDAAALDRIDESVEFGLPAFDARRNMVNLYFEKYIARPLQIQLMKPGDIEKAAAQQGVKKGGRCRARAALKDKKTNLRPEEVVSIDDLTEVARQLSGFSGREISKLFTALQTHILYSNGAELDKLRHLQKDLIFDVVKQKVQEHTRTHEFQVSGYDYVHNENALEQSLPTPNDVEVRQTVSKAPIIDISSRPCDEIIVPKSSPKAIPISLGFVPNSAAA